jgi:hypothetical protein
MFNLTLLSRVVRKDKKSQFLALLLMAYYSFPLLLDLLPCINVSEDEVLYRKMIPFINRFFPWATSYHADADSNSSIWTMRTLAQRGMPIRTIQDSASYHLGYMFSKYSVLVFRGKLIITAKDRHPGARLRLYTLWPTNEPAKILCQHVSDNHESGQETLLLYENHNQTWTSRRVPKVHATHMHSEHTRLAQESSQSFFSGPDSYDRRGRKWKQAWLFSGPMGTGKSTMCDLVGSCNGVPVYRLWGLDAMDTSTFLALVRQIPPKSILAIEDIDRADVARSQPYRTEENASKSRVDQQALLGWMSGETGQRGILTIWTTNHDNMLDPSLTRPGRIDKTFRFEAALSREAIMLIVAVHFDLRSVPFELTSERYPCSPAKLLNFLDCFATVSEVSSHLEAWLNSPEGKDDTLTEDTAVSRRWTQPPHGTVLRLQSDDEMAEKLKRDAVRCIEQWRYIPKTAVFHLTATPFRLLGRASYQMNDDMSILTHNMPEVVRLLGPDCMIIDLGVG